MIRNYPFHARSFINRVIRTRKRLIINEESQKNKSLLLQKIAHLEKLLEHYPFNTRAQMSRFIIRQAPEIMYLIPGRNSNSHLSLMGGFEEIYQEALSIRDETAKPALV